MTTTLALDPVVLRAAAFAPLTSRAITDEARKLVSALYEIIVEHEIATGIRKNARLTKVDAYKRAVGGFLGDLLLAQVRQKGEGWVYRSVRKEEFTGEAVSYRHFNAVMTALIGSNLIDRIKGFQSRMTWSDGASGTMAMKSWAPRFRATRTLLELAKKYDVEPSEAHAHFIEALPAEPLQARASKQGEGARKVRGPLLKWRKLFNGARLERGEALEADIIELNRFLDDADIRGGMHRGFTRGFNNANDTDFSWNMGGRLYGGEESYQQSPRSDRLRMTFKGEPVCEIDIRASYLTIFHAWHDAPLDLSKDPYVLPKLGEAARPAVKAWFVTTFGSLKPITRWPKATKQDYFEATGRDLSEYPVKTISEAVFKALPLMQLWGTEKAGGDWSRLMWQESDAVVSAMLELKRVHSVPSLAVHDSLIVPISKRRLGEDTLRRCYLEANGVTPELVTYPQLAHDDPEHWNF
jgi:hypothetical protein